MMRELQLLCATACLLLSAAPAVGAAPGATTNAAVKATVVKPLALTALQDLDFGTIILNAGSWSGATVSLSQTGALSCSGAYLLCSGPTRVARYQLAGSNRQVVQISAPDATLVNQSDSSKTLQMDVDAPASVTLPNSGNPGIEFAVGGSITLSSNAADGTYSGTLRITAEYQ